MVGWFTNHPYMDAYTGFLMNNYLPDAMTLLGLIALVTGVTLAFGYEWALMVAGLALMAAGVAVAYGRNR